MSSLTSPSLCQTCQGIIYDDQLQTCAIARSKDPLTWKQQDIYPDLPLLSSSSLKGCSFCPYLIYVLREKLPLSFKNMLQNNSSEISITLGNPPYLLRSQITYYTHEQLLIQHDTTTSTNSTKDGPYWLELIISSPAFKGSQWISRAFLYQDPEFPFVSTHLGISLCLPSPSTPLSLITSWLQTCLAQHTECQSQSSSAISIPTRLIDISSTIPRLITNPPSNAEYIALSYCWGSPHQKIPQLTTTTSTLSQRKSGIPLDIMPQTFQDLVHLTRHLGYKYIWIDALCIIQDDPLDWETEAAKMFSVYRDAVLTVVAGKGGSCHSGFLERNEKSVGSMARIPFESSSNTRVKGGYLLSDLIDKKVWDADEPSHMRGAIWASRGWTLQEDVMSRRVVYLTGETGWWRCQRERKGEQEHQSHYSGVKGIGWMKMFSGDDEEEKEKVYARWRVLIAEYSERKLSFEGDKYPAVSGLAKSFSGALGGRDCYLGGIWKGDLIRQLLWECVHDSKRPKEWRAPSWSWAAWDGSVDWRSSLVQGVVSLCSIEEARVVPLGEDAFGRLKDGWILMSASLRGVKLRVCESDSDTDISVEVCDTNGKMIADGWVDGMTCSGIKSDGSWKGKDMGILDGLDARDVVAAVIALGRISIGWDDDTGETQFSDPKFPTGLLLSKTGDAPEGVPVYRRVGVFWAQSLNLIKEWEGDVHEYFKVV
ncbi:HET domain-containing protein [Podospora fimiseda]|uniref:HET domain-containing protein n=1 Tax=Podospora fimiseda TaxID=252190 RepID=A0AAN7GRL3_9PEZI|nr:HET domain-containing protein [Podospora fimiseda]